MKPSKKIRLGDRVFHVDAPGRIGTVWELRASGRASVHWDDEAKHPLYIAAPPNVVLEAYPSRNKRHYKLENLRHAR